MDQQVFAAIGVLVGNQAARWFALVVFGPQRHREQADGLTL